MNYVILRLYKLKLMGASYKKNGKPQMPGLNKKQGERYNTPTLLWLIFKI